MVKGTFKSALHSTIFVLFLFSFLNDEGMDDTRHGAFSSKAKTHKLTLTLERRTNTHAEDAARGLEPHRQCHGDIRVHLLISGDVLIHSIRSQTRSWRFSLITFCVRVSNYNLIVSSQSTDPHTIFLCIWHDPFIIGFIAHALGHLIECISMERRGKKTWGGGINK